jgi:hypothetical protein
VQSVPDVKEANANDNSNDSPELRVFHGGAP